MYTQINFVLFMKEMDRYNQPVVSQCSDVCYIFIAVSALNVMFTSLNSPSQLSGWKSTGGDPCGESWEGIKCSGSAVTEM